MILLKSLHHRFAVGSHLTCVVAALLATVPIATGCRSASDGNPQQNRTLSERAADKVDQPGSPADTLVVAFYNVENLFDPIDDPETADEEFTPGGIMKWTGERLDQKLENISRALRLMDSARGPDIVGFAEVENREVLEMLVGEFMPGATWNIVHYDSPDGRGIDVALIYRSDVISVAASRLHEIDLGPAERPTRGILHVDFLAGGASFSVLVNHWPSRYGGRAESEWKREIAARTAASIVDSLVGVDPQRDIVLVGDLNDEPHNSSVHNKLKAKSIDKVAGESFDADVSDARMVNLAAPAADLDTIGTYLYRERWQVLDQIIVSPGLLDSKGLSLLDSSITIFATPFLRDTHPSAPMNPPRRTYIKRTLYIGGTSDHFPVFARFRVME